MAFKTKQNNNNNENRVYFELGGYKATVKNVRVLSETCAVFTLSCAGFALYNLRVVSTADGKEFIAPPSTKGKDGRYYDQYAIYLTNEDQKKLIDKVKELLNE